MYRIMLAILSVWAVLISISLLGCSDELGSTQAVYIPPPDNGNPDTTGNDDTTKVVVENITLVPKGTFFRGSDYNPNYADESPRRQIRVDSFYIMLYEVTNEDFTLFLNSADNVNRFWDSRMEILSSRTAYTVKPDLEKYPVSYVTWEAAKAYADWIGGRLPTEAEWEKAARGNENDKRNFPWGDYIHYNQEANFDNIAGGLWEVGTATGLSPYGCYDMAGNVWEWVNDWYGENYYGSSAESNPQGPVSGQYKIIRGGGFLNDFMAVRCSERRGIEPNLKAVDLGFRVTFDPENIRTD